MTLDEEKARILEQARQRALARAWAREQQRVRGMAEARASQTEAKRQLLSAGKVQGYDGCSRTLGGVPELADSANNISSSARARSAKRVTPGRQGGRAPPATTPAGTEPAGHHLPLQPQHRPIPPPLLQICL